MNLKALSAPAGIEEKIAQHTNLVYHLAFARTGNRYDAEEVFQEVFLRYVKYKPVFQHDTHERAWFIRVTINCCNSLFSIWKLHRHEPLTEDAALLETRESQYLHQELCKLPAKYREVLHLFYYEDMPIAEIAKALHRKPSTVRTQLTRARAMLKDLLQEETYVSGTI